MKFRSVGNLEKATIYSGLVVNVLLIALLLFQLTFIVSRTFNFKAIGFGRAARS